MSPTDVEIAWAAGLFEGEGCITASTRPDGYVRYVNLALTMTDLDVVEKFACIVGIESVKTYAGVYEGRKIRHVWQTNKISEVLRVYNLLEPHLGPRRRARAHELIAAYVASRQERAS